MRTLSISICLLVMVGCTTNESCASRPTDPLCQDVDAATGVDVGHVDGGSVDGGGVDAARDAVAALDAPLDAHVVCNGACTGTTPHCLTSTETCVACLASGDCTTGTAHVCATTGDHTCVECLVETDCTGGEHCDTAARDCVACVTTDQCGTAAAARCDTALHTCAACTTSADCTHLVGTGVCNAGACVQCTVTDETACGANSCNPATNTCTTTARTSVGTCRACVADSECTSAMDRCVPMQFMGAAHGSYCLRQGSAGCTRPYSVPTPARASTSGVAAAAYCGVDETLTTCEAVRALIDDTACVMASDCGAPGLADGQCQVVNLVAGRCTYGCGISSQCPSGVSCGAASYCGSP